MSATYRLFRTALLGCLAAACGTDPIDLKKVDPLSGVISLETVLEVDTVVAGETALVHCVARNAEGQVVGHPVSVDVTPAAAVDVEGGVFHLVLTAAIDHVVVCRSADQQISDTSPATLRVLPAAVATVETVLSSGNAEAGEWIDVACSGADAFGNAVDAADAVLQVADAAERDGLRLRLTRAGDYVVACGIQGVVDATAAVLSVQAGSPKVVETAVEPLEVRPREAMRIRCDITDAFGNAVTTLAPRYSVLADDDTGPLLNGLVMHPDGVFSITRAGGYKVFCTVPGYPDAADESPAAVVVTAGLPYEWVVSLLDLAACHRQRQVLPLSFFVYDYWGNEVRDAVVDLQATSGGSVSSAGAGQWTFDDEADYDITLTLVGGQHPNSRIRPFSTSLRVDSTPPVFDLESPAAPMLVASAPDSGPVEIAGWAHDAVSGVAQISVDGVDFETPDAPASAPFSVLQQSHWGLNLFTGWAEDDCGNRAALARSYLRSADFAPAELSDAGDAGDASVRNAIVVQLGQEFLNDRDYRDFDDVATALTWMLENMDPTEWIPSDDLGASPDEDHDGLIDSVTYPCDAMGGPRTNLKTGLSAALAGPITVQSPAVTALDPIDGPIDGPLDGMIRVGLTVEHIAVPIAVRVVLDAQCLGNTEATLAAVAIADDLEVELDLVMQVVDGRIVAGECVDCLRLSMRQSIDVDYSALQASGIGDLVDLNAMINDIIDAVEGSLIEVAKRELSTRLETAFGMFDADLMIQQGFDLPSPLQGSLNVEAGVERLEFVGPQGLGRMVLAVSAQVTPSERGVHMPETVLGAIRLGGDVPELGLRIGEGFAVSIKTDLINQGLWALWYAGALDIPDALAVARELFPEMEADLPDAHVSVFANLPPVVMPSDVPGEVRLGIGNLYVEAELDPFALLAKQQGVMAPGSSQPMRMGFLVSAVLGGGLVFDDVKQQFSIVADDKPQIVIEVVSMDDPSHQGVMSEALTQLLALLLPNMLRDGMGSFAMPSIELGGSLGGSSGDAAVEGIWYLRNASVMQTGSGTYIRAGAALAYEPLPIE